MHLNEVLDIDDIATISKKTNISEYSLGKLIDGEFCYLERVQCMGFISIIEREYKVDLSALRSSAKEFYKHNYEDCSMAVGVPIDEPMKEMSKFSIVVLIMLLLGGASWYFITKFDKKNFPFNEQVDSMFSSKDNIGDELSIGSITMDTNGSN